MIDPSTGSSERFRFASPLKVGSHSKDYKEQFDRYRHSLNNLIITKLSGIQIFTVMLRNEFLSVSLFTIINSWFKHFANHTGKIDCSANELIWVFVGAAEKTIGANQVTIVFNIDEIKR